MARRRRAIALEQTVPAELAETVQDADPPMETDNPSSISLANVRNEVLRHRTEIAHTVADLEAWKAEIECTLAFLRAKV
jgi:hypothetical protein